MIETSVIVSLFLAGLAVLVIIKTAVIVPQQQAYVVENLGKYSRTLTAGFSILIPFIERVAYKHSLKEVALDIPQQTCITRDNVSVAVDGILYLQVIDPQQASYGITDFVFAVSQLAQTTMRSEIGKMDLDKTFEERQAINQKIVEELDQAASIWGVKTLRYEIRNINPPRDIIEAMEKQMRAEREKRAAILISEGDRDAKINRAEGDKRETILQSEAVKAQEINVAEGEAQAILLKAEATAKGLELVGQALEKSGGDKAMSLTIAQEYVEQFGKLAQTSNTLVIPANLSELGGILAASTKVVKAVNGAEAPR